MHKTISLTFLALALGTLSAGAAEDKDLRWQRPADDEIRRMLSSEQYQITQREGTEPPFRNAYWDNKAEGI
jgi:peptide methionine sulfoxide reductase msrA/msrB